MIIDGWITHYSDNDLELLNRGDSFLKSDVSYILKKYFINDYNYFRNKANVISESFFKDKLILDFSDEYKIHDFFKQYKKFLEVDKRKTNQYFYSSHVYSLIKDYNLKNFTFDKTLFNSIQIAFKNYIAHLKKLDNIENEKIKKTKFFHNNMIKNF